MVDRRRGGLVARGGGKRRTPEGVRGRGRVKLGGEAGNEITSSREGRDVDAALGIGMLDEREGRPDMLLVNLGMTRAHGLGGQTKAREIRRVLNGGCSVGSRIEGREQRRRGRTASKAVEQAMRGYAMASAEPQTQIRRVTRSSSLPPTT